MTKTRSTKRALLMSALALITCVSMLIGSTFAWFTDSVTSAGNIIKSGTLNVTMEWADGTKAIPADESADWKNAAEGAIFNSKLWEPGYTVVRHIKIANEGTLALKYNVAIQANGQVGELAKVIDVYYIDPAENAIADRAQLNEDNKLGTLANVLETLNETASGNLEAGDKEVITLALKMQESAGNEYQDLAIGTDFSVILFATQYTSEADSFDNQYDANAPKMYTVNNVPYDTAEEALAAAKDGDKVFLSGVTAPIVIDEAIELTIENTNIVAAEDENAITVNANATIIVNGYNSLVGGKAADGIYVAKGATLTLSGKGNLFTKGNAGFEYFSFARNDKVYGENCSNTTDASFAGKGGSGIGVDGNIVIDGLANLTAEGYGVAGYGIGGNTDKITIKNTTINYARGGYVCANMFIPESWGDYYYGKKEPEGAPAIGSDFEGAEIEISNSTVKKAVGGSKGAGVGARYHTGVTINIDNSSITAFGGNAAAGIGGSRISNNATATDPNNDAVTINITKSTINATGGDYAAGIGSGYNTYDQYTMTAPVTKVTIDAASNITAQGGFLGAGIGTGHNVANFEGDIECDTTNVKAGSSNDKCCFDAVLATTTAQDIGHGVFKIKYLYAKEVSNGLYTDEQGGFYVYNADGFEHLNEMMANQTAGRYVVVKLCANIDMTGKTWTPVDSHADKAFWLTEFDGQGYTISNLTVKGQAMFTRFAGVGDVTVKNVTFDNATVDSTALNSSILTVQVYQNTLLDNVDVKNSSITGAYKVAPLVATVYDEVASSSVVCTVKNCDISNTVVTSTQLDYFTCGMISFVHTTNNDYVEYENCSITDVQLKAVSGGYDYHANIHYTSADTDDQINEHPEVKVTNVTFESLG